MSWCLICWIVVQKCGKKISGLVPTNKIHLWGLPTRAVLEKYSDARFWKVFDSRIVKFINLIINSTQICKSGNVYLNYDGKLGWEWGRRVLRASDQRFGQGPVKFPSHIVSSPPSSQLRFNHQLILINLTFTSDSLTFIFADKRSRWFKSPLSRTSRRSSLCTTIWASRAGASSTSTSTRIAASSTSENWIDTRHRSSSISTVPFWSTPTFHRSGTFAGI